MGLWVIIDKKLDENKRFKSVNVCGSIKAMVDLGLSHKGRKMTYGELYGRVSRNAPYNGKRYFIIYCRLITSKHKKR